MTQGISLPVVILAGGEGFRVSSDSNFHPKPMVKIGERPLLWHLIQNLREQGISEFIICVGRNGDQIRDYFLNLHTRNVTIKLTVNSSEVSYDVIDNQEKPINISIVETGRNAHTSARILSIKDMIGDRTFMCVYGDILADVNLGKLLSFHRGHAGTATLTAVHPRSRFNQVHFDQQGEINKIDSRPIMEDYVNGGFYIFEPDVFGVLNNQIPLEEGPLVELSQKGSLFAFPHHGFWQPIDTQRDIDFLELLWQESRAPWKNWG